METSINTSIFIFIDKMDTSSESNDDNDSDYHDSEADDDLSPTQISYDIVLSEKTQEKIKPQKTVYKDNRRCEKLNKIWPDMMAEKMWKVNKGCCCYKFKKHCVYKSKNEPYFYFYGNCTECGAKFIGTCMNRPSETYPYVTINLKTVDTSKIPHKRRRFVARERRKIAKESLQYIKPKHFKIKEACCLINDSDPIPALLSNSLVFTKIDQKLRWSLLILLQSWTEKQIKFCNKVN